MLSSSQHLILIGTTDNMEGEYSFYEEELYNSIANKTMGGNELSV